MKKLLYFICPTDSLEPIINGVSKQENYFYSSLGNSIVFKKNVIRQTTKLIQSKRINEINFVLSNDNRIVLDALGSQDFSDVRGLENFYHQIVKQKKQTEMSWEPVARQSLILSYHLNHKIRELRDALAASTISQIKIGGKIYQRDENSFIDIYPDLICLEHFSLN